jgi:hypothetical protein
MLSVTLGTEAKIKVGEKKLIKKLRGKTKQSKMVKSNN